MVGNHRTIAQTGTDDLSRYGGVFHPSLPTHQATTIFSPAASVTASTGFVSSLASSNKGEHIISSNGGGNFTSCPPVAEAPQPRDVGSNSATKKRQSHILDDKRKRKCWEVESSASHSPKVAIATPTVKGTAKITVPVALTSPTSRRNLSPVVGTELDPVTLSGTLPPKSTTYPSVANKKDPPASSAPGISTTSSLRAIRPCKTTEPGSTSLPMTSTTTSGIPVGIAVARQRSTSSHVAVTNTATTSYADLSGMAATHTLAGNNGMTATHSIASNLHGTANGLHSVATGMGPGQCLPAMTYLACDDGHGSNTSAWASPWPFPVPMESQMSHLSQPSNLQLVRDPASGQFLLFPTASYDPMPRTVMWPSAPGQGGAQLILPHATHPQPTPLILDNRLVTLSAPTQGPLSPSGGDKQGHSSAGQPTTLVKLEDSPMTGMMMPSADYSKALGSDTNGYAILHQQPSFINPNFSAISSSTGSFLIQHISRNTPAPPMQMSPAPTLFNNGARTNNLLISTQLPSGTQQLTLASPSADIKDNIATICYDNLYHNTTTTTMFNLQQTTSVMNQQTTSTQQMSTTSILVNDKMTGNATYSVEPQDSAGNNFTKIDLNNCNSEASVTFNNGQVDSGHIGGDSYGSSEEVPGINENSHGNEDSQTSTGTQEEEYDTEELVATKNDAGNQTDMPEESKADCEDSCSQESSVHNDVSDKPMSLNQGENNPCSRTIHETKEGDEKVSNKQESEANIEESRVTNIASRETVCDESNKTQNLFNIDTRQVSITPIVNTTNDSPKLRKGSGRHKLKKSNEPPSNVNIVSSAKSCAKVAGPLSESNPDVSSNKKNTISPESKKKIKQMPSLYPINQFLPNVKTDKPSDSKLLGFRSMPLLEDATQPANVQKETNDEVCERELVVNALMGLGNLRGLAESIREPVSEQNKTISCDNQGRNTPVSNEELEKPDHTRQQAEVKPTPRVFSVSSLLDKNFSKKKTFEQIKQNTMSIPEQSAKETLDNAHNDVTKVEQESLTNCDSKARDEIVEVANILCSALLMSASFKQRGEDTGNAFDSNEKGASFQRDSDSSGESGVDLSGLELLSHSIEQLERKGSNSVFEHKECHREKSCDPDDSDASHNDSGISRGLDLLCALARERILQEGSSPAVSASQWTARRISKHNATTSRWMSSDTEDEMFVQPYKPRLYKRPPGVPYKEVSHTYRSLKSEQETRRVLASKQTYQYVPPTSIDLKEMETRKLLAEIQREFREAQKELTRLTPKKSPHSPAADGGSHSWKGALSEAGGHGASTCVKRKPGRPRKTDKDVESLKISGKKVRDMIKDRSCSPSPGKVAKDRIEPRTKLSVQIPSTPSQSISSQVKSVDQSPPVLTPFSSAASPLDALESSRPVASVYYRSRLAHDDMDSEDSDGTEPPLLSPESQACPSRKRGRPPKKQATPEPPPIKKPVKPTFVSIVLANKNKQAREKSVWDDDSYDYKPNKIRPKLKAEVKVKTAPSLLSSDESDVSDIEERRSITVRKPSLAAASTHVKIRKSSQEPPEKIRKEMNPVSERNSTCTTSSSGNLSGKTFKKAPTPDRSIAKKHKEADPSEQPTDAKATLPSVKRAKRAESGSSVGSAMSFNTVPCETEQKECKVTVEYLTQHEDHSTRVLVLNEGLLYAGQLTAISPPDIYGVQLDGERAHRPNIYSQEEILRDVILEVKLAPSSVKPGKRMCAYWSQQYRCLYPGVVVSEMTTPRVGSPIFVNVEFDDGDSGSINVDDMRMLPQDFPLMTYENPLFTLGVATHKRKRRNSSTSVDEVKETKVMKMDETIMEENEEEVANGDDSNVIGGPSEMEKERKAEVAPMERSSEHNSSDSGGKRSKSHKTKKRKRSREEKREHKKHKKHKHKHRHKEKRHRSTSSEHSEKSDKSATDKSVTKSPEEHIKLAIKPIAEIVHKPDEDALKIIVKRDMVLETHIVNESNGKVIEKVTAVQKIIQDNSGSVRSADKMDVKYNKDARDVMKRKDKVKELDGGKVNAVNDRVKYVRAPEANGDTESLLLTISRSEDCPKIVREERKSLELKETGTKVSSSISPSGEVVQPTKVSSYSLPSCDIVKLSNGHEKIKKEKKSPKQHGEKEHRKSSDSKSKEKKHERGLDVDYKCHKEKKSSDKEDRDEMSKKGEKPSVVVEHKEPIPSQSNKSASETNRKSSEINPKSIHIKPKSMEMNAKSIDINTKSLQSYSQSKTNGPVESKPVPEDIQSIANSNAKTVKTIDSSPCDSDDSKPNSKESKPNQEPKKKSPKTKQSMERQSSTDSKSSMTHFLSEKQLWDWAGACYKKCTTKKKGRKVFYKSIQRGDESLSVGDCAVFLSTETDRPYIGKIDGFWESHASMNVKVKWFYHPEETVGCPLSLPCYQGALFEACHFDENDIQTISHRCQVLPLADYQLKLAETHDPTDLYYLAGEYDHINRKIQFEPGVDVTGGQEVN